MSNIPKIMSDVVQMMNNYLKDIVKVEFLDTNMSRKYPDNYAPAGYLGIFILIFCNNKQHKVFLKYQDAEDMYLYGKIEGFLSEIVRDDLIDILKKT